jgi:radical SAM protein with 4Fe4S-binding SPASM domain
MNGYVSPFWSYRPLGGEHLVTNRITGASRLVPGGLVDALAAVYQGEEGSEAGGAEMLALAAEMGLFYPSQAAAETAFRDLEDGWHLAFPQVDQIELTNRCPYSCKMCPRTTSMDRAIGNMPLDLFERIVEQIAGRQTYVGLHHFGESLVHPELPDAVALAGRYGLTSGLSCNPPTLKPRLAARLLEAGLGNMVLSLDSLEPETYREIRGRAADFDRADANLRELVRLRDEGGHTTWITLQMISLRCNQSEADRFLAYCQKLGVDRGVVIRLGRWDFDDEYVEQLGTFTTAGYTGYCSRPWTSVVVLWDGRVVPCCHDYNGAVVIGDLRRQSLEEVWRSPEAEAFRVQNERYQLCRQCAFSRVYREEQRVQEGFARFHRERGDRSARKEWLNPASLAARDGRALFDGFDVLEP